LHQLPACGMMRGTLRYDRRRVRPSAGAPASLGCTDDRMQQTLWHVHGVLMADLGWGAHAALLLAGVVLGWGMALEAAASDSAAWAQAEVRFSGGGGGVGRGGRPQASCTAGQQRQAAWPSTPPSCMRWQPAAATCHTQPPPPPPPPRPCARAGCGVGVGLGWGHGAAWGSKYIVVEPDFSSADGSRDMRPRWLAQVRRRAARQPPSDRLLRLPRARTPPCVPPQPP
jgi:hypothetical protein